MDALIETSEQFRDWWANYCVGGVGPPANVLHHPEVGRIHLDLAQLLPVVQHPTLTLVLQTPIAAADRRALMALLEGRPGADTAAPEHLIAPGVTSER